MLTHTMNHKEVIHELEKDLLQVWVYFYKKDFFKILKKKIGKRKVQYPIQYVETYTSKNNIEWGLHTIAVSKDNIHYSVYAMHRCKSGITVYKTVHLEEGENWQVFSPHFFDQYYKRFLQYEFDEPLDRKEVIQEFMLYNTYEYDFNSCDEYIEGFLSESSRHRLREEKTHQTMGAFHDGICFGLIKNPCSIYTTFISYDMARVDQEMLVRYLKQGLKLLEKGFRVSTFTIEEDRIFDIQKHTGEIYEFMELELMLGIAPDATGQKMTQEEAAKFIEERENIKQCARKIREQNNMQVELKTIRDLPLN